MTERSIDAYCLLDVDVEGGLWKVENEERQKILKWQSKRKDVKI